MLLADLWGFLKNPVFQSNSKISFNKKALISLNLLGLSIIINLVLSIFTQGLISYFGLELGEHAIDKMFNDYSNGFILFAAVVCAPVLEELIFRGPMIFFRKSPSFKLFFYILTLAFGYYHIINFEISLTVLLLSPVLVAPQILVGAILGFMRVRFGLLWAILLHACYNLVLVGMVIIFKELYILLE